MLYHVVMSIQMPLRMQNENIFYVNGMEMWRRKGNWPPRTLWVHRGIQWVQTQNDYIIFGIRSWLQMKNALAPTNTENRKWTHSKLTKSFGNAFAADVIWKAPWKMADSTLLESMPASICHCPTCNSPLHVERKKNNKLATFSSWASKLNLIFHLAAFGDHCCKDVFRNDSECSVWQPTISIIGNTPTPSLTRLNRKLRTTFAFDSNLATPALTGSFIFLRRNENKNPVEFAKFKSGWLDNSWWANKSSTLRIKLKGNCIKKVNVSK